MGSLLYGVGLAIWVTAFVLLAQQLFKFGAKFTSWLTRCYKADEWLKWSK